MITYYDVVSDAFTEFEDIYGSFSTIENAEKLVDALKDIDGFGTSAEDIEIIERHLELDNIPEWTTKLIENGKIRKHKYYNE